MLRRDELNWGQRRKASLACKASVVALIAAGAWLGNDDLLVWLTVPALTLCFIAMWVGACPRCGRFMRRPYVAMYCRCCGVKLDDDLKADR